MEFGDELEGAIVIENWLSFGFDVFDVAVGIEDNGGSVREILEKNWEVVLFGGACDGGFVAAGFWCIKEFGVVVCEADDGDGGDAEGNEW